MLLSMDGALSLWLWADGPRLWFWPIYSGQLWGTPLVLYGYNDAGKR